MDFHERHSKTQALARQLNHRTILSADRGWEATPNFLVFARSVILLLLNSSLSGKIHLSHTHHHSALQHDQHSLVKANRCMSLSWLHMELRAVNEMPVLYLLSFLIEMLAAEKASKQTMSNHYELCDHHSTLVYHPHFLEFEGQLLFTHHQSLLIELNREGLFQCVQNAPREKLTNPPPSLSSFSAAKTHCFVRIDTSKNISLAPMHPTNDTIGRCSRSVRERRHQVAKRQRLMDA